MSMRRMLRGWLEPYYRDNPDMKAWLHTVESQLERARTRAWESFPSLIQPDPRHIYLTLTANCNLACKGCRYGRDFMPGQQLSLPLVRDLLDDIRDLKFEVVRLYGGEPLMHKQIVDIVEECTRRKLLTYMTTNGILLKKKMPELFAAGLRRLSIGFYGFGEEYNRYVQRKDRFDQLHEDLFFVREKYGHKVSMNLNWLLMKPTCSVENVRQTWELCKQLDAPFVINLVHYSLPYFVGPEEKEVQFTPEDRPAIETVVGELLRLQKENPALMPMSPIAIRSIPDWLMKGPSMRVPCNRHRLIWIGADGTVQMCYVTFKLGNLHEKRLKDMLFTPEHVRAARDAFALNCPNCHCGFDTRVLGHAPTRALYAEH